MLTLGERTSLARLAPRSVIFGMLADQSLRVIQALLGNPQCTEIVPVRVLALHPSAEVVLTVLRHPKWGLLPAVRLAAVRSRQTPLAVAFGLLATFADPTLHNLSENLDLSESLRVAARALRARRVGDRDQGLRKTQSGSTPLASAVSPPKLEGQ